MATRARRPQRVVVVGAGFAGLSAAIRLRAAGFGVTVLERDARPGGRAGRLERDGFTFDAGPSVLTMPDLFDALFALNGERLADHVELARLDPAYRAVYHDGSTLSVRGSLESMIEEIRTQIGPAEADRFARLAARLRALFDAEFDTFIDANFDSPADLLRSGAIWRLIRLGGLRRVEPLVAGFLRDWRLIRLLTFQSMYAGMSPYKALGIYAVIAYMDVVQGVFGVRGGLHSVGTALAALAERMGVEVRLSAPVAEIEVSRGRGVAARTTAGERFPFDVVVLSLDLPTAYRDLLPAATMPRRVERLRYSPSCVVAHLGLDRRLAGAAHHNIHFAEDYRASFDDILDGRMQRDPSWFLSVPTVTDPTLAPDGGEVAFWLLPTPNLQRPPASTMNWDAQAPRELARAQRLMEAAGYGPVADATVSDVVMTPADWARQGMAAGTPFAASHHLRQTGPFRPANVAPKLKGVVFAGSGTVPGVGIPMVLVSGKLAAERAVDLLDRQGAAA